MIFHDYINPKEFYEGRPCKQVSTSVTYTIQTNPSQSYPWKTKDNTFDMYGWYSVILPLEIEYDSINHILQVCNNILCNRIDRIIPL